MGSIYPSTAISMDIPPINSIVSPGILPEKGLTVLVGEPGNGKTWLLQQMGLSISLGLPFLGLPTKQRKVNVLDLEMGEDAVVWRFKKSGRFYMKQGDLDEWMLLSSEKGLKLDRPQGQKWMLDKVAALGYKVLLIDNLRSAISGDENTSENLDAFYTLIGSLSNEYGVAVCLIAHPQKPQWLQGKNQPVKVYKGQYGVRGSSVTVDKADTLLVLERLNQDYIFKVQLSIEKSRHSASLDTDRAIRKKTYYFNPTKGIYQTLTDAHAFMLERFISGSVPVKEAMKNHELETKWLFSEGYLCECQIDSFQALRGVRNFKESDEIIEKLGL